VFLSDIIITEKVSLLSGLFGLAIKQYHKKSILFHFLIKFLQVTFFCSHRASDFVLILPLASCLVGCRNGIGITVKQIFISITHILLQKTAKKEVLAKTIKNLTYGI
jgi:hypothetical protein